MNEARRRPDVAEADAAWGIPLRPPTPSEERNAPIRIMHAVLPQMDKAERGSVINGQNQVVSFS
jgi:hypothetical protein